MTLGDTDEQQQRKLTKHFYSSNNATKIAIHDSKIVGFQDIDIPFRLELRIIEMLIIDRRTFEPGTLLDVLAVEISYLAGCENDSIQRLNFTNSMPWDVSLFQYQNHGMFDQRVIIKEEARDIKRKITGYGRVHILWVVPDSGNDTI